MRIQQYIDEGTELLNHPEISIFVEGPPGCGKTEGFRQMCDRAGCDNIVVSAPMEDPSTTRGYPFRDGDKARHLLFDAFDRAMRATKPTGFLIDDLPMASEATVKSLLRFVQYRELDGRKLPDCVRVWGAGNNVQHGAGVMGMIEPMKNRWHSIIHVEPHVEDTVVYGYARGWPYELCAFLRSAPDKLHDSTPVKSVECSGPTPRGWEHAADLWKLGRRSLDWIGGAVGKPAAAALIEFCKLHSKLPDPAAVILDPVHAPIPEDRSARYFVCCAMSAMLAAGNFGQILTYLKRFDQPLRAFTLIDAFSAENRKREMGKLPADYEPIHTSPDFTLWATSKDGIEILQARGARAD